MNKNKKKIGCTAKDLFRTMNKLAGSAKLRAETEEWFHKKGIDITIDKCGLSSLHTPLYVSSIPNNDGQKHPKECNCKLCIDSKNEKRKCSDCGKKSLEYVHAIGWECTNIKCHKKRQDKLIEDFNSKSGTEKLLMANGVLLSHKDHMLMHKKNSKKVCSDAEYKIMKKASDAGNYV
jgi:hypothetical protein